MPKNFKYRGRSLDELKSMSMDEFMNLLTSRTRRSLKRGLSHEQRVVIERIRMGDTKPIKTHARDLVVLPEMVGKTIFIHKGSEFVEVKINEKMLGHFTGEFSITNTPVRHGKPGIGASRSSMYIPLK
ncbi:MAG: 30S ribosomal protein S19 [Candidatus Bathyarchaeota archaeon]|jgi:small subunit ribosomal protein S19|nr:30S ribosomal protein S19 [Candidatus Bathyarchaeota archaeon]